MGNMLQGVIGSNQRNISGCKLVALMGKIISEDATNIFFPQTCDVLVDDVEQRTVTQRFGTGILFYSKPYGLNTWLKVFCDWVTGKMELL
jgi:hypothetical protein